MPSHLTRVVFRSIIANRPVLYRGCLQRSARPRIVSRHGLSIPSHARCQRRTFFDLFKPTRKLKDPDVPPGLDTLYVLSNRKDMAARPPTPAEVAGALNAFFSASTKPIDKTHVHVAMLAYKYLLDNPKAPKEEGQHWLSMAGLRKALACLGRRPQGSGDLHLAFARLIHNELEQRQNETESDDQIPFLPAYLNILCLYGASLEARELAMTAFPGPIGPDTPSATAQATITTWTNILQGFSHEMNEEELIKTVEIMSRLSVPVSPDSQEALVGFFTGKGDFERAKHWYLQPTATSQDSESSEPTGKTHAMILKACALQKDQRFGQQVVASLLKDIPSKQAWDAIFLWSAAIGKGVDEVDRMMNVMVRRVDDWRKEDPLRPALRPDVHTVNALVEVCMSKNDPYSAERYLSLGEKRGIVPNARTYSMQIEYRLSANDIDGAKIAWYGLQEEKSFDEHTLLVINKLIRALCVSKQHTFDDVMEIVDDLSVRKARFTPETVAMLCTLHLKRGESEDAIDLLQVHAWHYAPPQRNIVSTKLAEFILDRDNSTADAWDTYQILRQLFGEIGRPIRVRLMNEFFARGRPDMACHVFFHMRNHDLPTICPDRDAYADVFTGFARNADAESLELIFNQLKLDLNVDLDTKIRNSLMLAYAATGNNRRALEFWAEIVASKEGPTYRSIAIAFRSCEGMPWGDEHAKPIWRRLKEMDIDIDKEIWTAYLCALARNQKHDEAVKMLEVVEEEYGFTPDLYILCNWFNTTTNIDRQEKVEAWIKAHYPAVWTEMETLGFYRTEGGFGWRQFYINRDLDP
ncbi:hypothetical protein BCR34DRAFT_482374 [Clohesyomyces aquaticus]|uniref:Complex I intermediate-associated protein-like protein 84 n=1 Tax=Clohesyomyces aquaticus TaxID=1231657 RepID=A0A1Y1ZQV4_9PLEO|nr:hypothetical protein BCR34DRAFT_482374 [Clohesyomyces aquaticus]